MSSHFRRMTWLVALVFVFSASGVMAQRQGGGPGGGGRGGFGGFGGGGFGGGGFGGGSTLGILQRDATVEELKLTDEQKEKVRELSDKQREDTSVRDLYGKMRDTPEEEREKLLLDIRKATEEQRQRIDVEVKKILTDEQFARYRQLATQQRGVNALADGDISGDLKLTDEQTAKLKTLREEADKKQREMFEKMRESGFRGGPGGGGEEMRTKFEELRKEFEEKRLAVLTPSQKSKWTDMLGPESPKTDAAAGGSTRDTGAGSRFQRRPRSNETPDAATSQPADDGTPKTPVLSFGKAADQVAVAKTDAETTGKSVPSGAELKVEKVTFNFRHAAWSEVLKTFAELAGLTLDLDVVPPGTFNYFDEKEYSPTEALDVINGYLLQKGYLLVRRDQFLVVINIDEGIRPNLVPNVTLDELPQRGRNELINIILPIEGITAEEAAEEAKELIGPQGSVVALKRASAISVTDIGANVRRIHRLLVGLNAAPTDISFRSFELKHIDAQDAEATVRQLFGLPVRGIESVSDGVLSRSRSDRGDSRDSRDYRPPTPTPTTKSKVQVALDERTNRLLITAAAAEMKIIEDTLKAIDVVDEPGAVRKKRSREPYLEVYSVKSADTMEVAKTLNVLFPGCVVNEDGRARRLHIHASPLQHEQIERTIKQLDGENTSGVTVAVIPTGRIDALTATSTLQTLFAAEREAAPSIQPHPTGAGLIVRGTSAQVTQIKTLLTQMDPNAMNGDAPKGNLRTIPLGGRDPEEFMKLVQQLWATRNGNPIIVVPSDPKSIRDLRVPSAEPRTTSPAAENRPRRPTALSKPLDEETEQDNLPPTDSNAASPPARKRRAEPTDTPKRRPLKSKTPSNEAVKPEPRAQARSQPTDAAIVFASQLHLVADAPIETKPKPKKNAAAKANKKKKAQSKPAAENADKVPSESTRSEAQSAKSDAASDRSDKNADGKLAPILVVPNGSNLIVKSDDEAALDELETLIALMQEATPNKPRWTVFYLRSADASEAAAMLERLFPTSSVSSGVGGSSGMLGELTSGMGSMGRTLMNATGLNTLGTSPLTLRIVPEIRSNALYVSGPADQIREVEMMLKVLDASELPDQLRDRAPHFIEVLHADVEEVAALVREVYKDDLQPEGQQPGQQMNPLAMFMGQGGGGNRGSGRSGQQQQPRAIKLTLGVDTRTSTLIVSASETLFRQIEALVQSLDDAAREAKRTVRVVDLNGANSALVQQALGAMYSKIKVTSSSSRTRSSSSSTSGPSSAPPASGASSGMPPMMFPPFGGGFGGGGFGGGGPSGGSSDDMRRMFESRMRDRNGSGQPSGR